MTYPCNWIPNGTISITGATTCFKQLALSGCNHDSGAGQAEMQRVAWKPNGQLLCLVSNLKFDGSYQKLPKKLWVTGSHASVQSWRNAKWLEPLSLVVSCFVCCPFSFGLVLKVVAMAAPCRVEEWFQMVPHLMRDEGSVQLSTLEFETIFEEPRHLLKKNPLKSSKWKFNLRQLWKFQHLPGWNVLLDKAKSSLCYCDCPWGGQLIKIRVDVQAFCEGGRWTTRIPEPFKFTWKFRHIWIQWPNVVILIYFDVCCILGIFFGVRFDGDDGVSVSFVGSLKRSKEPIQEMLAISFHFCAMDQSPQQKALKGGDSTFFLNFLVSYLAQSC